jgi:hypothetical protein
MKQPAVGEDGFALPGFAVDVRIRAVPDSDRDMLGRLVREEWIKWAKEQPNPKPSWLVPWEELSEPDREVDRRIGVRLAGFGALRYLDIG